MEAIWAAAITGFFGLVTALVTVFRDEIRGCMQSKRQPVEVDKGEELAPIDSIMLTESNHEAIRKRPFDTRTELLRSPKGDAFLFKIHLRNKGWIELFFMTGWIVAWTVGIVFAAFFFFAMLFGGTDVDREPSGRIFSMFFIGGWLVAALAGEFAVAKAIKKRLASVIGRLQITISANGVTVGRVFGGLKSRTHYDAAKIDGFGESEKNLVNLQKVQWSVYLRCGVQRIEFEGMSANEAEWLEQQLNNASKVVSGDAIAA